MHHDFCYKILEKFKNIVMMFLVKPLQRLEFDQQKRTRKNRGNGDQHWSYKKS
jgi:hypothetical protein